MSWQSVAMTDRDITAGRHIQLQQEFDTLFVFSGTPLDAAMFKSSEVSKHIYYFSPGAVRIATILIGAYGGVDCPTPSRSDLHGLVANADMSAIPFAVR
jgi:hypothetical protein